MFGDDAQRVKTAAPRSHPPLTSSSQLGARTAGPKKKQQQVTPLTRKISLGGSLFCLDFHPGCNMLAIGGTKKVHIVEITQTSRSGCGPTDGRCAPPTAPVSLAMRTCGEFSNNAKVEHLAWYPGQEAVLAFVQMNRNITVLFDVLLRKEGNYVAQQRNHPSRQRILESSVEAGSGPLNTVIVSAGSMPSTPFAPFHPDAPAAPFVERNAGRPGNMVEVVIKTGSLEVERVAWDPHTPYTLAFTSKLTHFEVWTINVVENRVYTPVRVLRPRAHNERTKTHDVAFSPFDPNLIVVAVGETKTGKVIVYDRRHLEMMHSVETSGPSFVVAFHPTFADLLAVCYRKSSVKGDSRVQFFHLLSEESLEPLKTVLGSHYNNTVLRFGTSQIVERDLLRPIDCIDSLNRFRWQPCGSSMERMRETFAGDASAEMDVVSSQLWFATMASKGHEISVYDATNEFFPIFSIKAFNAEHELTHREVTAESLASREINDCVWVNALSLVYVCNNGDVTMTSLLDKQTIDKETLFWSKTGDNTPDAVKCNVFSLCTVLPTAAVVSHPFGRMSFLQNASSSLLDYYVKVINVQRSDLLEQLTIEDKNDGSCGSTVSGETASNSTAPILSRTFKQRESSRVTPKGGTPLEAHAFSRLQLQTTFTPPHATATDRRGPVFTSDPPTALGDTISSKRPQLIFPFLFSLDLPSGILSPSVVANPFAKKSDAEKSAGEVPLGSVPPSTAVSFVDKIEPYPKTFKSRLGVLTQLNYDGKVSQHPFLHSQDKWETEAGAETVRKNRLLRSSSAPVDVNTFDDRDKRGLFKAVFTPVLPEPQKEDTARHLASGPLAARREKSFLYGLHEKQRNSGMFLLGNNSADGAGENEAAASVQVPPLGKRSYLTPTIEQRVLSNEMCGWAYVERSLEEETFVHYALEWEMGYKVARQMKVSFQAFTADAIEINEHAVDRQFARMMAHNAKVCKMREKKIQRQKEVKSMNEKVVAKGGDSRGGNRVVCGNQGEGEENCENSVGLVDPRGGFWAALTQAWRSHNVSIITGAVCDQLEYCSLVGDVQYCIVLYLLFCLWWKQRHRSMEDTPCPLLFYDNKSVNRTLETEKARKANGCTSWHWRLRALQWAEHYLRRLSERKLYVSLNELTLIIFDVMGSSIPGLLPDEDKAQKSYTCVYCGTCSKAELVPRLFKPRGLLDLGTAVSSVPAHGVSKDGVACANSDNESSDTCSTISCSSSVCTCAQTQSADCGVFDDDVANAKERTENYARMVLLSAPGALPRNAFCSRCCQTSHMTCVICEEVVEGMYLWLRSCGHGGHVDHIEEWLKRSNECPLCGVPILPSKEAHC